MDNEVITWIDSNGVSVSIDDGLNYTLLLGANGLHMPPVSTIEDDVPDQAGTSLRKIKIEARELDLPLVVRGNTELDVRNNLRALMRVFNPLKGDGRLRVTSYDGSQRELYCRYIGGLEIDESPRVRGHNWQKSIIVLKAFDPFWYDTATQVKKFTSGEPVPFFPLFPLRLNSSNVFADTTIDNTGDVETWPEWIVTGPGEQIKLRNLTTGEIMYFEHEDAKLGIGESITITTKPFQKKIIKNDGSNLFYTLSEESSLWALQDGNNAIRLEMSGATEESSIQLSYRNRYWGP